MMRARRPCAHPPSGRGNGVMHGTIGAQINSAPSLREQTRGYDHFRLRSSDRMDIVTPSSGFPVADPAKRLDVCPCDHRAIVLRRREEQPDGCWQWLLRIDPHGYGRLNHRDFAWLAHRFSYEAFVGRIPNGLQLDHLCRNRACVNPAHLEPVTPLVNTRRSFAARGITRKPPAPKRPYLPRANVTEDDPRHGTRSGYVNLKCRCPRCREANRLYQRKSA